MNITDKISLALKFELTQKYSAQKSALLDKHEVGFESHVIFFFILSVPASTRKPNIKSLVVSFWASSPPYFDYSLLVFLF